MSECIQTQKRFICCHLNIVYIHLCPRKKTIRELQVCWTGKIDSPVPQQTSASIFKPQLLILSWPDYCRTPCGSPRLSLMPSPPLYLFCQPTYQSMDNHLFNKPFFGLKPVSHVLFPALGSTLMSCHRHCMTPCIYLFCLWTLKRIPLPAQLIPVQDLLMDKIILKLHM